jgi:hypothetical protein
MTPADFFALTFVQYKCLAKGLVEEQKHEQAAAPSMM